MTEQQDIDATFVAGYRRRRVPSGFAARVAAHARASTRRPRIAWRSAAAVAVAAGAALAYVLAPFHARMPLEETAQAISVPPAPDYWADISVPVDPPVSGLSDFGSIPLFPPTPEFGSEPMDSDRQSQGPRRVRTLLSHSLQQESNHESV